MVYLKNPSTEKEACMWYVGLDVHWRSTSYCILDGAGRVVKEGLVRGHWSAVVTMLKSIREPMTLCYEASCGYGHLYDQLTRLAQKVVVAHPGKLRLIFGGKRKNDRVDARKLATLLLLNQVPPVHVPAPQVRQWRLLIEFRRRLMDKRVAVKNQVRAMLRGRGVEAHTGRSLWTKQGLSFLGGLEFDAPAALQRDVLLSELLHISDQLKRVTKRLDAMGRDHAGVQLLRTIPGVGPRTAEAMVAYLDDPRRFQRNKCVGAYLGLVPREDSTGGRQRLGHITKEGPGTARKLLVEAAWQAVRRSPAVRSFYERVRRGDPQRGKIALVATAHWLARAMHAMLRDGTAWREPAAPAAPAA
jgi:transposase